LNIDIFDREIDLLLIRNLDVTVGVATEGRNAVNGVCGIVRVLDWKSSEFVGKVIGKVFQKIAPAVQVCIGGPDVF
jgi:hypothetical protein